MTACVRFQISGRVQGVGFRAATQLEARRLGLHGWVRNLPDGRVEVLALGDPDMLRELEQWLRNGPRLASVDEVQRSTDNEPPMQGFMIR